jgi:tryptophan synthase alpha chain
MQPHERITAAIRRANEAGGPALVAFLTAGYPSAEGFLGSLRTIAEAADVVEIGVPFSDPMADGMTIQRASRSAIANGASLRWIFAQLAGRDFEPAAPLLLMSYLNPLLNFGFEALARRAAECGVCGFIVPDLPLEECAALREALEAEGVALVQMVTPATPSVRARRLSEASRGFVYAVTMTGITGGGAGLPEGLADYLDRVRSVSPIPVCAGFGIRDPQQVGLIGAHAHGAVVGSALVEVLERSGDPGAFLRGLRPVAGAIPQVS